ncbi:uncharacterized protein IWZ02DRAFT_430377 [Phyllosticta citriasiana]|uniref:Uncharacterized protein n=1 Tax=Phyllosticta citriasiana TaxID=595635 RepID=A0ABR1KTE5_9PEZI
MADDGPYHPKDTIGRSMKSAAILGSAGVFVAATQNTLARQNYGAMGVFTKFGATAGYFTALGTIYEFTRCSSANLRRKDDTWNEAIGGFFGGAVIGLKYRSIPAMVGFGVGLSTILATFHYTGHTWGGVRKDPDVDHVERVEQYRRNWRHPSEETVAHLGEGRGIYLPGYEDRRRELLKEKYGYEIKAPPAPR